LDPREGGRVVGTRGLERNGNIGAKRGAYFSGNKSESKGGRFKGGILHTQWGCLGSGRRYYLSLLEFSSIHIYPRLIYFTINLFFGCPRRLGVNPFDIPLSIPKNAFIAILNVFD